MNINNNSINIPFIPPTERKVQRKLCDYLILNYFVGHVFAPTATKENLENNPSAVKFSATREEIYAHLQHILLNHYHQINFSIGPGFALDDAVGSGALAPTKYIAERGSPAFGFLAPLTAASLCRDRISQAEVLASQGPTTSAPSSKSEFLSSDSLVERNEQSYEGFSGISQPVTSTTPLIWNPWRITANFTSVLLGNKNPDPKPNESNLLRFVPPQFRSQIHLENTELVQNFFSFVRKRVSGTELIDPCSIFTISQLRSEDGSGSVNDNTSKIITPELQRFVSRLETIFSNAQFTARTSTPPLIKATTIKYELKQTDPSCQVEDILDKFVRVGKLVRFRCTNPDTEYIRKSTFAESYGLAAFVDQCDTKFLLPTGVGERICDQVTQVSRDYWNADAIRVIGYNRVIAGSDFLNSMMFLGWKNTQINAVFKKHLKSWRVAVPFEFSVNGRTLWKLASSASSAIAYLMPSSSLLSVQKEIARLQDLPALDGEADAPTSSSGSCGAPLLKLPPPPPPPPPPVNNDNNQPLLPAPPTTTSALLSAPQQQNQQQQPPDDSNSLNLPSAPPSANNNNQMNNNSSCQPPTQQQQHYLQNNNNNNNNNNSSHQNQQTPSSAVAAPEPSSSASTSLALKTTVKLYFENLKEFLPRSGLEKGSLMALMSLKHGWNEVQQIQDLADLVDKKLIHFAADPFNPHLVKVFFGEGAEKKSQSPQHNGSSGDMPQQQQQASGSSSNYSNNKNTHHHPHHNQNSASLLPPMYNSSKSNSDSNNNSLISNNNNIPHHDPHRRSRSSNSTTTDTSTDAHHHHAYDELFGRMSSDNNNTHQRSGAAAPPRISSSSYKTIGVPRGGSVVSIPPPALVRNGEIVRRDHLPNVAAIFMAPPPFVPSSF